MMLVSSKYQKTEKREKRERSASHPMAARGPLRRSRTAARAGHAGAPKGSLAAEERGSASDRARQAVRKVLLEDQAGVPLEK